MHGMTTFSRAGMRSCFFVTVLFFMCSWHVAYAVEQKLPCAEEIAAYCKGVKPGGGRLLKCLKEHHDDLSTDCREKVAAIARMLKEAQQACSGDIDKFCKDIRPGEGRIIRCLNEHAQEISSGCSEKIESAKQMVPPGKRPYN